MDRHVDPALLVVAALSVPLLIIETGPDMLGAVWPVEIINWGIWAAFTANFAVRMTLAPDRRAELRHLTLDLVIVVGQPLAFVVFSTLGTGTALVRFGFVVLRTLSRGAGLRRTWRRLRLDPLPVVAGVVPLLWFTSAALVLRFERPSGGSIATLGDALWWSAATLTTVGYGDLSPKSPEGRIVAVLTMVAGIGLFSIVTAKLAEMLLTQRSRAGRGDVFESGHVLILGWSTKTAVIVGDLLKANEHRTQGTVVVLTEKDREEVRRELLVLIPDLLGYRTEVLVRTGARSSAADLVSVRAGTARAVVVPETDEGGTTVHTVLALLGPDVGAHGVPIVVESTDPATTEGLRRNLSDHVTVVDPTSFLAHVTAQSCLSPGVAVAWDLLLRSEGSELHVVERPELVRRRVDEASAALTDACLVGVLPRTGPALLNPPADRLLEPGDRLVVVAENDDAVHVRDRPVPVAHRREAPPNHDAAQVLILHWSTLGERILTELGSYLAPGSHVTVATDDGATSVPTTTGTASVELRTTGYGALAAELAALLAEPWDHVLVLADRTRPAADADARSLMTMLQVRAALDAHDAPYTLVTELLDERDTGLAPRAAAGDFIVSDRITALLLAQLAETPSLAPIFEDLLSAEGSEMYAKPAGHYCEPGAATTFATIAAAALGRGETAIGYRRSDLHDDPDAGFGIVLNPLRDDALVLAPHDQVVVLALDQR
jgi:voltage-gated potassium channel Kch